MACLYCGKEIGPLRLLRDGEFCSSAHRKNYGDRLGKALDRMAAPEPPPAGIAAFRIRFPLQEGNHRCAPACAELESDRATLGIGTAWPVTVARGGGELRLLSGPGVCTPPAYAPPTQSPLAAAVSMPRLVLAGRGEIGGERKSAEVPPLCDRWMPAGRAEAAERCVTPSMAEAIPGRLEQRVPGPEAVSAVAVYVPRSLENAVMPAAEIALVDARAIMDCRPARRAAAPPSLRFSLHTVDETAGIPALEPIPEMAGVAAAPEPTPVEAMPSAVPLAPVAMAPAIALRKGDLAKLLTLVPRPMPMPAAGVIAVALSAMPVESMPSATSSQPVPMARRMGLRRPTLVRFQPAQDAADRWAAPAAAPPPAPLESLPSAPAFKAIPIASPVLLAETRLRAALDPAAMAMGPFSKGREIVVAEPEPRLPDPHLPALEPLARISSQLSGTQPERPKPEVPQAGLFPLEYHCHRIDSLPIQRLAWMDAAVPLSHPPFAVKPALRPLREYTGQRRRGRSLQKIFTGRKRKDLRVRVGYVGKIAATVMVGLALWAGSRLANLSGEAQAFRAQVELSERTVTAAAEVRRANPGTGRLARVRHAIADRAATQVTDTFASGMEAWGAAGRNWAPGWQYSRNGYVKTGEMALFRPSLNYSDYRMEFYGQIENKSMGWVVRARDKQNYYAMKFKIIEPGLRPIIAMVHYQVSHGRRGHTVETPLSVMVHNNQPYHVSVEVHGNHFAAAIEGEPVESWTDDALAQGGVGFFSEAGERARLYWMRVSRNQDWLGRFCAYLSGDFEGGQQTAEMRGPEPAPRQPEPAAPPKPELALVETGAGAGEMRRLNRVSLIKHQRVTTWIS